MLHFENVMIILGKTLHPDEFTQFGLTSLM